jgi:hypothetical protein
MGLSFQFFTMAGRTPGARATYLPPLLLLLGHVGCLLRTPLGRFLRFAPTFVKLIIRFTACVKSFLDLSDMFFVSRCFIPS